MRKSGRRIVLALAVACGLWLAWVSTIGTPPAIDALPSGAFAVIEARDAAEIADRLADTRFATAFSRSATREWLEGTRTILALDALLAEVKRITGISLGRRSVLDLVGTEAGIAWYPAPVSSGDPPRWAAAGRLSLRGWAMAAALRLAERAVGAEGVVREELAGRWIYTIPGGAGAPVQLFLAGRMLVACSDRDLAVQAAQALRGGGAPMSRDPALRGIRDALPSRGELFVWVRSEAPLPGMGTSGRTGVRSVGALLKAGATVEIELAAEPPAEASGGAPGPVGLPALSLLKRGPLAFLSSRQPVPAPLIDLLQQRLRAAAHRRAGAVPEPAVAPGRGFAVVVTESGGTGLLPAPQGLIALGLRGDTAARDLLPLLFPPGARSATTGGLTALASRESIPLAGEFELWGAADGSRLLFATDPNLIASAAGSGGGGGEAAIAEALPQTPDWRVEAVAEVSMEKALPLLRRWSGPLSALLAARWPGAPELTRDLGLAEALRSVRAVVGSDGKRDRSLVTLHLRDLK